MNKNRAHKIDLQTWRVQSTETQKPKPYIKPCLIELGDLRSLTLGPSFGLCESGHETSLKDDLMCP